MWQFDRPVADIWPVMSDTARFNEAAELPKHQIEEIPQTDGSVLYLASGRFGPVRLEWAEKPVNWVHEQWFEHCRYFTNGPLEFLCARMRLIPEGSGCRCEYTAQAASRNLIGDLLLSTDFFAKIGRTFTPLAESAAKFARGERDTEFDCKPPKLGPGAHARADDIVTRIEETPHGHGLARRLADWVLTRQDVDVWNIHPLHLARIWDVPARHGIEVCLEAVKQGLLRLRWDLLCPRCQVGKESVLALDQLPAGAHCGTCNIDYDRDFSNSVELAFHPANAVRPVENGEYCLFGPMSTPHIKVQLTLGPDESETVDLELDRGHYRLRTLEAGDEQSIVWEEDGFPEMTVDAKGVHAGSPADAGKVVLHNRTGRPLTLIIEEQAWTRDALTAKRATSMQAFRDLFNADVLRPGDHVEIDYVAIMVTDLKGSTALYEKIGDPEAYVLVREHFAVLGAAVRENNGVVVKTIGDAIMGAFDDPRDAFTCAVQIQDDFERYNADSGRDPAIIKLGIHAGRCISVTLNNRLDYYGTAANKAARLQGQSDGGDIVLSPEFAADPLVASMLADYEVKEESALLKGFHEPIVFLRISDETLTRGRTKLTN